MSGLPATACSLSSTSAGEPAYGSAAPARFWIALEQPGPWGHDALTESHLDPDLGRHLRRQTEPRGGRVALVRAARRHADKRPRSEPFVAIASAVPGQSWLVTGRLSAADELRRLDVEALAHGDRAAVLASLPSLQPAAKPLLLVCTNGRRDVCCAVFGRPVAHDAGTQRPGQVWETSHTGGHRFSPTAVLLPWGITLARLDSRLAVATLDSAAVGRLPIEVLGPAHDRGRSSLAPAAQAAEATVRASIGEGEIEALRTSWLEDPPGRWTVSVEHADGRNWAGTVHRGPPVALRAASCGRAPDAYTAYDVLVAPRVAGEAEGRP